MGQWFLEIYFESFAQDLASPSARSFAQEFIDAAMKYCGTTTVGRVVPNAPRRAENSPPYQSSQHIIAEAIAAREGQRPRCPCGGESGSGDAAPPGGLCRKQSNQMKLRAKIPHEIIEASFMREALRHFLLENQMSHASYASYTSHPQAESKARSTSPHLVTFTFTPPSVRG